MSASGPSRDTFAVTSDVENQNTSSPVEPVSDYVVFLDESIVDRWGPADGTGRSKVGKRILVGAVVTPAGSDLVPAVADCHRGLLADPTHWDFRGEANRLRASSERGLHFADDSIQMKEQAIRVMATQDFRAHVYFADLESSGLSSEDLQSVMYFNLIRTLLLRYAGLKLLVVFENCTNMNARFGRILTYAARSLDRASKFEPSRPRASVSAALGFKPCGGLSTIDYCLGIANLHLQWELRDGKEEVRAFERELVSKLNPNIAHVVDYGAAVHRSKFPILERPRWAEDILGASSPSSANRPFSTLISSSPTGPFQFRGTNALFATALGLTAEQLEEAIKLAGERSSYQFRTVRKRGKERTFISPRAPLLNLAQRRVADFLRPFNELLHPGCVGYVPGRRTLDAATPHSGKPWVQKLDITDFYSSAQDTIIHDTFVSLGATQEVSETLTSLVTWEGVLPTGTRTSPVVSNLVLADFDFECAAEAERRNLAYTRYADDLIFSGDDPFDMSGWVDHHLQAIGFKLNPRKSVLCRRGQPIRVAGLTIFEKDRPRLPKALKRRLRLEIYLVSKDLAAGHFESPGDEDDYPPEVEEARARFFHAQGMLRYSAGIEPAFVQSALDKHGEELRDLLLPARRRHRDELELRRLLAKILGTRAPGLGRTPSPIPSAPPISRVSSVG